MNLCSSYNNFYCFSQSFLLDVALVVERQQLVKMGRLVTIMKTVDSFFVSLRFQLSKLLFKIILVTDNKILSFFMSVIFYLFYDHYLF